MASAAMLLSLCIDVIGPEILKSFLDLQGLLEIPNAYVGTS
jgi:hypothetical protein